MAPYDSSGATTWNLSAVISVAALITSEPRSVDKDQPFQSPTYPSHENSIIPKTYQDPPPPLGSASVMLSRTLVSGLAARRRGMSHQKTLPVGACAVRPLRLRHASPGKLAVAKQQEGRKVYPSPRSSCIRKHLPQQSG